MGDVFYMTVKILTDSTCYIGEELKKSLDIRVVSLNVTFDTTSFKETDIINKDFYKMMDEKGIPISSQPTVADLYAEMKSVTDKGDKLLCIFLSSKMSGTYSTAHIARDMVLEDNNAAEIEILDSKSNCMQLGFADIVAARTAKEGEDLKEVKKAAEENIKKSRFLFIPDNLVYLKKGGRIGGASALIGNILKIIPILTVENGVTTVYTKVRTKKKALEKMLLKVLEDIKNYGLGEIVVHHINCYSDAKALAGNIANLLKTEVKIYDIGPVIGLHVGPGAIGIAYYTEKDMR